MPVKQGSNSGSWKPGQSGNAKGRPRLGNSLAELLRTYLDGSDKSVQRKMVLVQKLYQAAIGDNCVPAARLIFEIMGLCDIESEIRELRELLLTLERTPT